jgi:small GTP-binding protein
MSAVEPHHKVIFLGDPAVGKTALVERATEDIFQDGYVPTVGAQFTSLEVQIGEKKSILELWDTAGQEIFRSLVGFYSRDARGAFLVYDVTSSASFDNLPTWLQFTTEHAPGSLIILFGNKIDLAGTREVSKQQGEEFAKEHKLGFIEGSAKTGENVRDAYERMTEMLGQATETEQSAVRTPEPVAKGGCC